jgi:hypothetical protein
MIARAAAQAERARQQAEARQRATTARQMRDAERRAKADAKEASRLYIASRMEEVDEMNRDLQAREAAIDGLLIRALKQGPAVSIGAVQEPFVAGKFNETPWQATAPKLDNFKTEPLGFSSRMIPGASKRQRLREHQARTRCALTCQTVLNTADALHKLRCDATIPFLSERYPYTISFDLPGDEIDGAAEVGRRVTQAVWAFLSPPASTK